MEKVLIVDADKCTGCQTCELVCSMVRSGEYNPEKSLIKVMRNAELDVSIPVISVQCDFCGKCAEWFIENAPLLNPSLVKMDDVFSYGKFKEPEKFFWQSP